MTEKADLLNAFDYIRLSTPDLNGIHLYKLVPQRYLQKVTSGLCDLYVGSISFGPRNEVIPIPEVWASKFTNGYMKPDLSSTHVLPWAEDQEHKHRVGSVICELEWPNRQPVTAHPRYAAGQQLKRLDELGYKLYSAFEPEFRAFKSGTKIPFTDGDDMYKAGLMSQYEKFFMEADRQLAVAGVEVQDFSCENGAAQLEMPLIPRYGIEAADMYFIFKQGIKEIGRQFGMTISFMTKPLPNDSSSGCHYNHSLISKETGKNAMFDNSAPDKLSEVAIHWIGGLVAHLGSIMALCSPTVNCYRRLHHHLAPDYMNWDIDDRFTSVRAKNRGEKSTYVENRIPSSSSSPYHVMAATVAAGIDGLKRKLQPPPRGSKEAGQLPHNFAEALDLLEKDQIIVDALGPEFVKWFLIIKRGADLKVLQSVDIKQEKEEDFAAEQKEYFDYF